jgi:Cu(I)/Ag(I) efflux system membrane fusion protein
MSRQQRILVVVLVVMVAGAGAWLAWRQVPRARPESAREPAAQVAGGRTVLYWYDPMRPDVRFDAPGRSPFMDMELRPKYADEAGGSVVIDPRMVQSLGVRTAKVQRGDFAVREEAAGAIAVDERRIEVVESRAQGWVERLHVRAVDDPVRRDQLLAEIFAPDLYAAQEELLLALRMAGGRRDDALVEAARGRLALLGVDARQIARVEQRGASERRVSHYAPFDGIVAELGLREGQRVEPGMPLFRLVDLSRVWVTAEIPEARAAAIAAGDVARARVPAFPGRSFEGRVEYLYPGVRADTRTLAARILLENPGLELKPGMYAQVTVLGQARRDVVQVPSEALIPTGARTVVILAQGAGRFEPVAVRTGAERDGWTEIVSGLEAGQEVAVSGQFLIDSEASLRTAFDRLSAPGAGPEPAANGGEDHEGHPR